MESLWTRERINTLVDESKQGGGIYLCHWRRRASCQGVHFRMIRRWEDLTIAEFLTICDGERGRMILYRSTFLQPAVFAKKLRNLSSLAGAWQWTFLGKLNNVDVAVKLNFLRFPPLVSPKFTSTTVMRLAYLLPLESSSAEVFVSADFQSKSIGFAWLARVKIVWPNLWCSQQEIAEWLSCKCSGSHWPCCFSTYMDLTGPMIRTKLPDSSTILWNMYSSRDAY
jgi:hypothetical protein